MKGTIKFILFLMGWGLIFWGIFSPIYMEHAIQKVLGLFCCGIGFGMSLERM